MCLFLPKVRHTKGFSSIESLRGHYFDHVLKPEKRCFSQWAMPTEEVYLRCADGFAGKRKHAKMHECVVSSPKRPRRNGRRIRYDETTDEFLAVSPDGYIVTYFIPEPGSKNNPYRTNLEYFRDNCRY